MDARGIFSETSEAVKSAPADAQPYEPTIPAGLHQPYRQQDVRTDSLIATVWQGFEKLLLAQLPDTERIYTTYEDIYERLVWDEFLKTQGYRKVEKVAFVKEMKK